jgi:signal transduction histidine kinase
MDDRTEHLNAIFELLPDGFVAFDAAHKVNLVNPAFLHLTGLAEADIIGCDETTFSQRVNALCQESTAFPGLPALLINSEGSEGGEGNKKRCLIELTRAHKPVLEVGLRVSQSSRVSQLVYFRDVTREVEVERMKSEFLSTAAHELRTPMANISGYTELLSLPQFDTATRQEFIDTIGRQADLMTSIINELLDLARIEARRGKDFKFERLDLVTLVSEAVNSYTAPKGRNPPLLHTLETSAWVRADRKKMLQAINNVLSNAYKYSPKGGPVEVNLTLDEDAIGVKMINLAIDDQGVGLTPQQLSRVCERFFRADTSSSIPGTGLGMSIVKEIMDLHHGRIAISSTLGKGAKVTLALPVA